jgi:predicted dithiol-disulfide oxidoreductase (DUF899 family)
MRKSMAEVGTIPKTIPGQTRTARRSAQPHIFEQEAVSAPTEPSPGAAAELDPADSLSGGRSSAPMRMQPHKIVSEQKWIVARKALLAKEKAFTKARDRLSAERRKLPWVKVEKNYVFDGSDGKTTLGELFAGRSQLIIYHFMFGPGEKQGCPMCSFLSDHIDGALLHLKHHDVSLVVVSRALRAEFEPYRKRMGWHFKWVSSNGSEFNRDYHVSFTKEDIADGNTMYNYKADGKKTEGEAPGISAFYQDERGEIFHTYSCYARGGDLLIGAYNYLDLAPKGRNEASELKGWVRRHDEYELKDATELRPRP